MTITDIIARLGISLSAMQQAAIEAITTTSSNIVLLSPTGSGKTLAYLLPLSQLVDASNDAVQAIVIVPGRELAEQSAEVLQSMKTGLRGYACHGGRPAMDEHRDMRRLKPQIVFATPGRLNDHLDKLNIEPDAVRFVVIDEFDKCLDMGFADEMSRAVGRMPAQARRIFISATDVGEERVERKEEREMWQVDRESNLSPLSSVLSPLETAGFLRLDYRKQDDGKVQVQIVRSPDKDKLPTLSALLRSLGNGSSIVFLNYRDSVERTASFLTGEGFTVSAYHGGLNQEQREEAVYRFANGSATVLVSTDLGSRGLDIPNVANIIHYHLPETPDNYTHRIGRTARWDKTGRTLFLLGPDEQLPPYVTPTDADYVIPADVPAPPQPVMATLYIGRGRKEKISKGDIVGFLCKTGGLRGTDIGRIDVYDYYSYAAIARDKLNAVLRNVAGGKIKGQRTRIEEMK